MTSSDAPLEVDEQPSQHEFTALRELHFLWLRLGVPEIGRE
jgi:hypothetical protein